MAETCRELDLSLHLDGARLFNAAVASGVEPSTIAGHARHGHDLLLEGARLPARGDRRGLGGADGAGAALQAPVRRRDAAGGDRRGGLRLRARSQRRAAGRGPRTCAPARPRRCTRRASRSTSSGRDELRPARRRLDGPRRRAMRPSGCWPRACASSGTLLPGVLRAVTHLGIADDDIDHASRGDPSRARRSAIARDEERERRRPRRAGSARHRLVGSTSGRRRTSRRRAADAPSAAISTGLKESASGSIAHERSATAGMRKTATWAPEESAISAARSTLPRCATTTAPPCSAALPTIATITAATKKSREVRLLGEGLDRADEDLGDQRGDHGRDSKDADRGPTAPRRLLAPRPRRAARGAGGAATT